MATVFPISQDVFPTLVDNVDTVEAAHPNDRADAIEALEAKVGVNNSNVTTTLDYLIKNSNSTNPGHLHPESKITFNTTSGHDHDGTDSKRIYAAKGLVNFDGTGSVTINNSVNVTSITDNGTGDYTINWTTAFSDTNYIVVGTCGGSSTGYRNYHVGIVSQATNNVRIETKTFSGATWVKGDVDIINIIAVQV